MSTYVQRRRVHLGWLALAVVALVVGVIAIGVEFGACAASGQLGSTCGPDVPSQIARWVVVAIALIVAALALVRASRRKSSV